MSLFALIGSRVLNQRSKLASTNLLLLWFGFGITRFTSLTGFAFGSMRTGQGALGASTVFMCAFN
jgi:hypothetical protein